MRLVWSRRALRRLASIHDYIAKDSPIAAAGVGAAIVEATVRLQQFPLSGRQGRIEGTRELVVPGLPYILPYRIVGEEIQIASVVQTSRQWPETL
ncbi:MAG: type II toxin-antitoxin system RelE/ParE family toxin [Terracidiphilus sp.]